MSIIRMQRRLVEVGRIRIGEKNDEGYPTKLDQFRLTSRDRQRLDAAAQVYGGEVAEWEREFELKTGVDALDIAVVPGQAISQHMELWGQKKAKGAKNNPVVRLRRCDGQTEQFSDGPCLCATEEKEACQPTTRLSVVLTRVPGIGVWRLDTKGWNAARELTGAVELLETLVVSRRPVRARLRLDRRTQQTDGPLYRFVVPVIDIDATLDEVLASVGPAPEAPGHFTPVPVGELPPAPVGTIDAQFDAVNDPAPGPKRSNAAEPIRPTGLDPRPVADVLDDHAPMHGTDATVDIDKMDRRALVDALGKADKPTHGNVGVLRERYRQHLADA